MLSPSNQQERNDKRSNTTVSKKQRGWQFDNGAIKFSLRRRYFDLAFNCGIFYNDDFKILNET